LRFGRAKLCRGSLFGGAWSTAPVADPMNDRNGYWNEQRRQHESKAQQACDISGHGLSAFLGCWDRDFSS
jgi:hypothetical protein